MPMKGGAYSRGVLKLGKVGLGYHLAEVCSVTGEDKALRGVLFRLGWVRFVKIRYRLGYVPNPSTPLLYAPSFIRT